MAEIKSVIRPLFERKFFTGMAFGNYGSADFFHHGIRCINEGGRLADPRMNGSGFGQISAGHRLPACKIVNHIVERAARGTQRRSDNIERKNCK